MRDATLLPYYDIAHLVDPHRDKFLRQRENFLCREQFLGKTGQSFC